MALVMGDLVGGDVEASHSRILSELRILEGKRVGVPHFLFGLGLGLGFLRISDLPFFFC